jgi:hypothetical protein
VGKNPLPNYVATKLLLKEKGTLHLVHSRGPQGTGGVAQRLATQLSQYRPQLIPVDPLDTSMLHRTLEEYLKRVPLGSIGLNYTGGTKVMAVHTYQVIGKFCHENRRDSIFSYLDADTLTMAIEPQHGQPAFQRNVAQATEVSIKELLDLHSIQLREQLHTEPVLPDLAYAVAQLYGTNGGVKAWQEARNILQKCANRSWLDVKGDLARVGIISDVVRQLEQELGLSDAVPIDLDKAAKQAGFKKRGDLTFWFEGPWLEHWVLACIRNLGYTQRAQSLKGRGLSSEFFEIDVAVMRGYQLFAMSCGVTTDRGEAKLKLLEVYARAQQMGGDEARIAAVCSVDDPVSLEQEIAHKWDVGKRVRVFGRQHLPDLQTHLAQWFNAM